jgi:hypothetical protein
VKTSYDLSFLTSPRDPRLDNWIGQPFVLSYLNSEPGTNYVLRYRPFGINHSHIERERRYADRMIEKTGIEDPWLARFDRIHTKENAFRLEPITKSWKPLLESIASHDFTARVQEATAIVEFMTLLDELDIPMDIKDNIVMAERFIEEKHINPILSKLYIEGYRVNEVKDTLLHLYGLYNRDFPNDTVVHKQVLMDRVNIEKETIELGKWIVAFVESTHANTILPIHHYSERITERDSTIIHQLVLSEKARKDTALIEYRLFVHTESIGLIYDGLSIGQRDDQIGTRYIGYSNGSPTINIGHIYEDEIRGAIQKDQASIYDGYHMTEKSISSEADISDVIFGESFISKIGIVEDLYIKAYGSPQVEGFIPTFVMRAGHEGRDTRIDETIFTDRFIESKEVELITYQFYDRGEREGTDASKSIELAEWFPAEGIWTRVATNVVHAPLEGHMNETILDGVYFDKEAKYGLDQAIIKWVDGYESEARVTIQTELLDAKVQMDTGIHTTTLGMKLLDQDAWLQEIAWVFSDALSISASIIEEMIQVEASNLDSAIDTLQLKADGFVDSMEARIDAVDYQVSSLPLDGASFSKLERRMEKLTTEAYIQYLLQSFTTQEKAAIIHQHWETLAKVNLEAMNLETEVHQIIGTLSEKEAKPSKLDSGVDLAGKDAKQILILKELMAEPGKLNGYLKDLMGYGIRPDEFEATLQKLLNAATEDREGRVHQHPDFTPEPINEGIIQGLIEAHDQAEKTREGYIPDQQYRLSGDNSDWDDIWNRYSPGVDILDPPDADYDYEKLASKVYNLDTGVPYKALSPTNVPDVRIKTPLHHPLPQHYDIGVDDTKQIIVDNYVYIDVTLAIESLKNRNKLKYAGMPAEKAMRDVFSKLFTWITQAAPGSDEYNRMFRFCRWYAESATLSLSDHILHRTYNSWRSQFHTGGNLGIPYTSSGWQYFPTAYVLQTNSEHSEMKFESVSYIDGEFIVRGYFDNPLSQGTMEIKVDGEIVDTVSVNGAFTRTYEVPQGKHTYEFIFDGSSGRVSLSNLEITGSVFVSAHTSSDDSNTNGLKAATTLINMLLTYFDKHHGGGKSKGTMAIKQRKLWLSQ